MWARRMGDRGQNLPSAVFKNPSSQRLRIHTVLVAKCVSVAPCYLLLDLLYRKIKCHMHHNTLIMPSLEWVSCDGIIEAELLVLVSELSKSYHKIGHEVMNSRN